MFQTDWESKYLLALVQYFAHDVTGLQNALDTTYNGCKVLETLLALDNAKNLHNVRNHVRNLPLPDVHSPHWVNAVGSPLLNDLILAENDAKDAATLCEALRLFGCRIFRSGGRQTYLFLRARGFNPLLFPSFYQQAAFESTHCSLALLDEVMPIWTKKSPLSIQLLQHAPTKEMLEHAFKHPEWFGCTLLNMPYSLASSIKNTPQRSKLHIHAIELLFNHGVHAAKYGIECMYFSPEFIASMMSQIIAERESQ